MILEKGFLKLKTAFELSSPGTTYKSTLAKRRLLRMPLASLGVGSRSKGTYCVYLVAKQVNYRVIQTLLNHWIESQNSETVLPSKETINNLIQLAHSDAERKRLKYAIVNAAGLSNKKAKAVYGFGSMATTNPQVENALHEARSIREAIEEIAEVKQTAILRSLHIACESDTDSDDESETDDCSLIFDPDFSESDSEKETGEGNSRDSDVVDSSGSVSNNSGIGEINSAPCARTGVLNGIQGDTAEAGCADDERAISSVCSGNADVTPDNQYKNKSKTEECKVNTQELLDLLYCCHLNWIEFVCVLEDELMTSMSKQVFEELLLDFAGQISFLGLKEQEEHIIEQSRQVYLLQKHMREREQDIGEGIIVSDSDSDDPDLLTKVSNPLDEAGKKFIRKRRAAIWRKAKRQIKKRIAEKRFLGRRRSKRVGRIQKDCPDIGKTVEEFVQKCGVGADAWRRTGVLTFDGNKKVGKKVTFKRIQEHLQAKYQRTFSYGTVVELCVARNKRRKSSIRYKGLANVTQRRARKGFTAKYNPDAHWSAALYSGLDKLQYTDGHNIMNLGRDDQAGFRLDTLTTHKQHASLCLKNQPHLTTRTDYVNRYPSVLQTTSYNFPPTGTTGEICGGIVKAQKLFPKNPAQHFADFKFIESKEEVSPSFMNPSTGKEKEIECVRVDGSSDEGPVHEEVQYWWTKRHLQKGSKATLVSTRSSGSSYRNRVELQNGCLALGHANLYIPSTLNGSCIVNGKVDEEILCKNLDTAIDVYISRVDKSPCANTPIHLWKGADSSMYQEERTVLIAFLKGAKKDKEHLRKECLELYDEVEKVWELRNRHMVPNLPMNYIFYLQCCYDVNCIHPVCQTGKQEELHWFTSGPNLSYLPVPTPDPNRPFGGSGCKTCKGFCAGHYLKPNDLLKSAKGKIAPFKPPSEVLANEFKKHKKVPADDVINALAKQVLLPPEEVRMWLSHLQQVSENRLKGAKKAAATRKRRKSAAVLEDVCLSCKLEEPEGLEDGEEDIEWVACDSCAGWYHTLCVNIETVMAWYCESCSVGQQE